MIKLLIVDDEEIIRQSLSATIDYVSMGYQLIGNAKNGMEAYDIIRDEYPEVVITDLKMPILGGLELIERTYKFDKNVIFIILSGYGEFEYAKEAMKYGVRYYITKPTKLAELREILKEVREKIENTFSLNSGVLEIPNESGFTLDILRQSFIIEAVEFKEKFDDVYRKYKELGIFKNRGFTIIYIYYLEESFSNNAAISLFKLLKEDNISLILPIIYVKNTLLLITSYQEKEVEIQNRIQEKLGHIGISGFEMSLVGNEKGEEVLKEAIFRISRYKRILINFYNSDKFMEVGNTFFLTASGMAKKLEEVNNTSQRNKIMELEFRKGMELEELKVFCINVYLQLNGALNMISGISFFKEVFLCSSKDELLELMKKVLDKDKTDEHYEIKRLKEYIETHIDSEELSLKWIAENILFINVDYLSRLFVKEEKMRFSEYLNAKRMELATKIMLENKESNIKNVAKYVGFGNNPRYFGQVFKKYIGVTPTEYIRLKIESVEEKF